MRADMPSIAGLLQAVDTVAAPARPETDVNVPTGVTPSSAALLAGLLFVVIVSLWLWNRRKKSTL
jgi:LPXTG-motif cell wall-anchored protein